jgi:hypothetical protein
MIKELVISLCMCTILFSGCIESRAEVANPLNLPASERTPDQNNIIQKNVEDNRPGEMKIISVIGMTGQIMFTDTVKGKVTSSNKRLFPNQMDWSYYIDTMWGKFTTSEMPGLDKTFGSSSEYLYYWNTDDQFTQIYPGSNLVVISSRAINPNTMTFMTQNDTER